MENRTYKRIILILILVLNACVLSKVHNELLVAIVSGLSLLAMGFICSNNEYAKNSSYEY